MCVIPLLASALRIDSRRSICGCRRAKLWWPWVNSGRQVHTGKKNLLYDVNLRYMMGLSRELSQVDLKQIGDTGKRQKERDA